MNQFHTWERFQKKWRYFFRYFLAKFAYKLRCFGCYAANESMKLHYLFEFQYESDLIMPSTISIINGRFLHTSRAEANGKIWCYALNFTNYSTLWYRIHSYIYSNFILVTAQRSTHSTHTNIVLCARKTTELPFEFNIRLNECVIAAPLNHLPSHKFAYNFVGFVDGKQIFHFQKYISYFIAYGHLNAKTLFAWINNFYRAIDSVMFTLRKVKYECDVCVFFRMVSYGEQYNLNIYVS